MSTAPTDTTGSLTELFRRVAAGQPDAAAVIDDGDTVDYGRLDALSDRLAARLARHDVRPGDLVGLLLERSADIPIGILGVLKAGAAYVPLDPAYPAERLRYVVADAGVRVVVGDPARAEHLGLEAGVLPVREDGDAGPVPEPATGRDDPAYVIYTSGSTGKPKGCVVTHGNVLALLDAALPLFDVSADDRWALFHSFNFDVSVWEFWASTATGATAVTVPERVARSAEDLLGHLATNRITVLGQVPSVFRSLAKTYLDGEPPELSLRYLVFAGESVDLDVIRDFLGGYRGVAPTAVNMYGPTETTVYATHRTLTAADFDGPVPSPIGTALPHLVIDIRGADGEPLPDGETGEMWIAGTGVATGYLDRPELTAERFVTAAGPSGPTRYYRTGDLARRLPDGSLEYLGRNDQQIKLRGYRIELDEVAAALRGHEAVRDVAVTVVTTPAGAQFLVACVVPEPGAPDKPAAVLREHTTGILPRYMVPDRYQVVERLPLTASGKLDREALRELATPRRPAAR
ncbi:MAG: amino acid adenylation domain-containing protein [Umezawaea sp.]